MPGILGEMGPIPDMELTDWNDVMAVNLTAAFMAAKAQIPAMRKNGGDSIVFTSPFVGCSNGSMPGTAAYAASKAGLNELVQSLCRDFSFYFEEKKVDFKLALSKSKLPISMDALALEEAISNLIENAIKYGGEEKHLLVKTYIKDDHIFLEIADQGIGIPQESQGQIFDKFYRVENALTQKTKGTGLGLSLVKHIVQAHGGKITVSTRMQHLEAAGGSGFDETEDLPEATLW